MFSDRQEAIARWADPLRDSRLRHARLGRPRGQLPGHFVEDQARTGRYGNTSDDVRDLIRRDQERLGRIAAFQALVDEGLASGVSSRSMAELRRVARDGTE